MGIDLNVVLAIAGRELRSYMGNPAGYVFLTLFIVATGAGAFLQAGFFSRNLADLALLNKVMPVILILFVPAVTMNVWAEERRRGTDELLLTLPVRDLEVVVGKYLGAVGVYTFGLMFALAHLVVLVKLGSPDMGLMFATYLGYWLVGIAFVAIGLLASMFSANATVAFILGAVGCAGLVFAGTTPWASGIVGCVLIAGGATLSWVVIQGDSSGAGYIGVGAGLISMVVWLTGAVESFQDTFALLGVESHVRSFGEGIIRIGDVVYFLSIAVVVLYLCTFMLGRRHWKS